MAPYQAFAIGGLGSVRGYGEGAVGSGRSCLVANGELRLPVVCNNANRTRRVPKHVFLDQVKIILTVAKSMVLR